VLFQPQIEDFEGREIVARAAVALTPTGATTPVFGAVWLQALIDVDRDVRTVSVYDIRVDRVRFPETLPETERLVAALERELPTLEFDLSLDRFLTSLENVESRRALAGELEMAPPVIVFRAEPSVLVMIDGDPVPEDIEGTNLARVINTPFLIVRDGDTQAYFLYAGADAWYTASTVTGDWSYTTQVPATVVAMAPDSSYVELPTLEEAAAAGVTPAIVVATEPTELIFTNGAPAYTPLADARLMYISNTDSTLILEIETQRHFTVLSGRWYFSVSLDGPWAFIESADLPEAFRDIPADSDIGDIRIHVAGTEEANEAVLDAEIPQTATIERGRVYLEVIFDGEPVFEQIPGTSLRWAVNTDKQVLAAEGRYWVCDEAVWYVSDSPLGPWEVAVERPQDVDLIPPENPNYNLKYTEIYGSTSDLVYVGYTPGYTHTYVYNITIVYGTGFHHPHWHSTMFFPRHATWGFHVRFHPWWGWSSGIVFSNGRFTFGIGFGGWTTWHRGWWGPVRVHVHWRGHPRGFYRGWNRGFYAGARAGFRAGARAGYRRSNLFRERDRTGARVREATPRPGRTDANRSAILNDAQSVSRTQANNVMADRDGNVFRSDSSGAVQQRVDGNWSPPAVGGEGQAVQAVQNVQTTRQRGTQLTNASRSGARGGRRGGARGGRRGG